MAETEVIAEIVDESGIRETEDGLQVDRTYLVRNLTGETASRREYDALGYVPQRGDPHESIPRNIQVEDRRTRAASDKDVYVTVRYRTPTFSGAIQRPQVGDSPQLRTSGTLVSSRTQYDKDDNLMVVYYPASAGCSHDHHKIPENVVTATIQRPRFTFSLRIRETTAPDGLAEALTGKVNELAWRGYASRTVLCTAVLGDSPDGGDTWINTYEFARDPDTWDYTAFAQDPETGEIPGDATVDPDCPGGIFNFRIYSEVDFNSVAPSVS